MADLDSTRVYGDLTVTGEAYVEGTKLENVNLTGGTNVTLTGTYPNITISSTDTNTTYSAGNGLTLSGTAFSLPVATSGSGTFVTSITQTATGITANLGTPPNTNTTYSNITAAEITTGTATTLRTLSGSTAKLIADRNVGTANPVMDGAVRVGTSLLYSRQDHRHPVDTSRAAASHTHTLANITDSGNLAAINTNASTANYLRGDGNWVTPPNTNTTYSAGNGINLSGTQFTVSGGDGLSQTTTGLAVDNTVLRTTGNQTVTNPLTLQFNGTTAPLRLSNMGTANPTVLASGDMWVRSNILYARLGTSTRTIAHTDSWAAMSVEEGEAGTATSNRLMRAANLKAIIKHHAGAINGSFYESDMVIDQNYTVGAGKNSMVAGPITINNGVTVTIPDGSTLVVV